MVLLFPLGRWPSAPLVQARKRALPFLNKVKAKPGSEYFVRVSFALAADQLWAKNNYEVASQQFELPIATPAVATPEQGGPLTLTDAKDNIKISGSDFNLEFSKAKGTFSRLEKGGENLLQ